MGAFGRRLQRRLGMYDAADFLQDLRGNLCRVITTEKFIDKLLDIEDVPPVDQALPDGCVGYVASRLSDVPALVSRMGVTPGDEFWDIGCGLGGLGMLVAWLTGARVRGVEFHREYCDKARASALDFGLPNVTFTHADARDVTYDTGTKFFMFLPFLADVQDEVLEKLRRVAEDHPIVIGWQGPRVDLQAHGWLEEVPGSRAAREACSYSLKIFRSRQP